VLSDTPILTAYVDETGNHDLEVGKEGASNLFICVAVLVDGTQKPGAEAAVRELAKREFGGSEIKSSGIGGRHERRLRVLGALSEVDFGYYAMVVDKARLDRDSGLQFKGSFHKFLSRMLYQRLASGSTGLAVVADMHGGRAFMDSFTPYLAKRGLPGLFSTFTHRFADSAGEPLIQLADLIAGSLSYVYDPAKRGDHSRAIVENLRPKQIGIGGWPLVAPACPAAPAVDETAWDERIRAACIARAEAFGREHDESPEEDRQMQLAVLRHLLFLKEYGEETGADAIHADTLIAHLRRQAFPELTRQAFSSRVIGPLRDAGLVLAGSNDGYRLATSTRDVRYYLDHDLSLMEPMLARLKTAREHIRQATANGLDILSLSGYACLKRLVEAFEEHRLASVGMRPVGPSSERAGAVLAQPTAGKEGGA